MKSYIVQAYWGENQSICREMRGKCAEIVERDTEMEIKKTNPTYKGIIKVEASLNCYTQ